MCAAVSYTLQLIYVGNIGVDDLVVELATVCLV